MNTTNLKAILLKIEPIIFLLVIVYSLYPILARSYFPFVDAPAHLYNAKLIKELLQGNALVGEFIKFNPVFVPNSISYIITTPLLFVFSTQVSEKILLLCYFIGLPLAFRYCVSAINKEQRFISFLIIPFVYNFLIMIGFFNFCLGFVFMFLTIGFFYKNIITENTKRHHYFVLFLLIMLSYCCHVVVFGLMMICLLFIYTWASINKYNFSILKWFNRKTGLLIAIALPSLYLSMIYFKAAHSTHADFVYLDNALLIDYFKSARFFVIFNETREKIHSDFLSLFYVATFFICIYLFVKSASKNVLKNNQIYFLLSVFCSLLLYKLLPDSDGLAGYVSVRLCLLTYLIGVLTISVFNLSNRYLVLISIFLVYINFLRLPYYKEVVKENYSTVEKILEQGKLIEPNSFVAFKKQDDSWLSAHYSNYLGINKTIICLENYECSLPWFPLKWKKGDVIWALHQNILEFKNLDAIKTQLQNKPIYYFILGDLASKTDSTNIKLKQDLGNYCTLINATNISSLYKFK